MDCLHVKSCWSSRPYVHTIVLAAWGSSQESAAGHLAVQQESSHIFCLSVHIDSSVKLSDQRQCGSSSVETLTALLCHITLELTHGWRRCFFIIQHLQGSILQCESRGQSSKRSQLPASSTQEHAFLPLASLFVLLRRSTTLNQGNSAPYMETRGQVSEAASSLLQPGNKCHTKFVWDMQRDFHFM